MTPKTALFSPLHLSYGFFVPESVALCTFMLYKLPTSLGFLLLLLKKRTRGGGSVFFYRIK